MALIQLLLLVHMLGAALWVGGMATMVIAVRPSLALIEAPPQRVRFIAAVFARLFAAVAVAIVLLFASGLVLVVWTGGFGAVHWSVHAMLALALVMVGIFVAIRFGPHARLRAAIEAADWPAGAQQVAAIRRLIGVNLALGLLIFVVATLGRVF